MHHLAANKLFLNNAKIGLPTQLKPEAFLALNEQLISQFYADEDFGKFHGFRLLAMDGSTLELPESQEIVQHYGRSSNQETSLPMARCSLVHDVVNHLTLDAILAPYLSDDRTMARQHMDWFQTAKLDKIPTLLLFDRGYPSIDLIAQLQLLRIHFLMRISEQCSMQEIREFATTGQQQITITLNVMTTKRKKNQKLQAILQQLDHAPLVVRLLSIDLPDGSKEYLITDLIDDLYTLDFFGKAYRKRWGIETQYAFDKTLLEIENFSSKKVVGVQPRGGPQDFYASILCRNINAILNLDAQQRMEQQANRVKPHEQVYQVNRAVSLGLLKDEIIDMLFGSQPLEASYDKLVAQMSRNKSLSKPNRNFNHKRKRPRKPKSNRRRPT